MNLKFRIRIVSSEDPVELLSGIKEFVLPEVPPYFWDEVHREQECHDVIQWLKVRCAIP